MSQEKTYRVLVSYTQQVLDLSANASISEDEKRRKKREIEEYIQRYVIEEVNECYATSRIEARIQLAKINHNPGDQINEYEIGGMDHVLRAYASKVSKTRNRCDADIGVLLMSDKVNCELNCDGNSCRVHCSGCSGGAGLALKVDCDDRKDAFVVSRYNCASSRLTVAHEIAHLFGCDHSNGYTHPDGDWCTIMVPVLDNRKRRWFFSNPALDNKQVLDIGPGVKKGSEGHKNCALLHNERISEIVKFRFSQQSYWYRVRHWFF